MSRSEHARAVRRDRANTRTTPCTDLGATKAWAPAAHATAITADFIFGIKSWVRKEEG